MSRYTVVCRTRKYGVKAIITITILFILVLFEVLGGRSYFDEILGLCGMLYMILLLFARRLTNEDKISVLLLLTVICIGVLSNVYSKINVSIYSVLVDLVVESKFLWVFFATKYFVTKVEMKDVSRILRPFAKIFAVTAMIFALISQVVNIGMTGSERYGLKEFKFFFPMSFQFLAVAMVAIAVISNKQSRKNYRYYICMCIALILATKSSPLLFSVFFLILLVYLKKREELKTSTLVILGVLVLILGTFQIQTYLLNENAPRYLFFYYGGKTANTYFPFGAGFSTFGSDQAARNYSELYFRYGFNGLFGMNQKDGSFLSDTFWAMALGQFGWIGFILYVIVYIRIFNSIKKVKLNLEQRAFCYAAYAAQLIHAVGSAILSSSAGVISAIAIGMILGGSYSKNRNKK